MAGSQNLRSLIAVGIAAIAAFAAIPSGSAQSPNAALQRPVLPPLSFAKAQYFRSHPQAWAEFLSRQPRQPAGIVPKATEHRFAPPIGGSWQAVTTTPAGSLSNPLLLTDGTVLVHQGNTPNWYKLTPDITGSYATGTWSQIASMPVIGGTQYSPQYFASAVLPDGRVIVEGGEYNGTNSEVWTTLGAIYNPVANKWTAVSAPAGWGMIGDPAGVVLANGTFMLGSCCNFPDTDALLDPATLTWTSTGAPAAGGSYQDEQGYELMQNNKVLTVDIWTNYPAGDATNAEQYNPTSGTWGSAGSTPVVLADPSQCGNYEIGPAVVRENGTVVAFGGNSGCVRPTVDPIAIYDPRAGTWSSAPNVPKLCGTGGTTSCTLADAPAALLPNGSILFAASAGYGQSPTHFFEFSSSNTIRQVADPLFFANSSSSYYYNFLDLPNGQILSTDFSSTAEVYTPVGIALAAWAPVITNVAADLTVGHTYTIDGKQLNGRSAGSYYGDDAQGATNYPIVQIVNVATGHVFYARTHNFSSMSVKPNAVGNAKFILSSAVERGPSSLFVIANGIASQPTSVTVH